jgi:hypothetical protein
MIDPMTEVVTYMLSYQLAHKFTKEAVERFIGDLDEYLSERVVMLARDDADKLQPDDIRWNEVT